MRNKGVVAVLLALVVGAAVAGIQSAGAGPEPKYGPGGKAVVHKAGGKIVPPKGLPVPEARWYDTTLDAGEPTLGFFKDGSLIYVGADIDQDIPNLQAPNQVDLVRSDDTGESWQVVSPRVGNAKLHFITLDPYVWVDQWTDRVYTIDLTVACSYMSYSDDQGESWITNPLACGRPVNDHQTLFGGPPAVSAPVLYENVMYYCWNDVATSSCSKSLDGGLTWSPTGSPAFPGVRQGEEEAEFCGGLHGHGVVGHDGTVYLPREYCEEPWLAISHDEGASWDNVRVSNLEHAPGSDPNVAVDEKGNVYYAWIGPKRLTYLAVSKDGGGTWGKPLVVSAPGVNETNIPAVDVGEPGKVAITYYGTTNSPGPPWVKDGQPLTLDYSKTTWNAYLTMSVDVLSGDPTFISASLNPPSDPLVRDRCGPGRCKRVFDFIDVEIAPDGTPWAALVDHCTEAPYPNNPEYNCATKPIGGSSHGDQGLVGRLIGGPRLR